MSAPAKLQDGDVTASPWNWEAHLEALPLPTWIMGFHAEASLSQGCYLSAAEHCGPVFANRACREILGLSQTPDQPEAVTRYFHPEDRKPCLEAWESFLQGYQQRFHQIVRWIRPDTKETVTLSMRAQRLLCGDIQGWIRSAAAEQALSRLEELCDARR